MATTERQKQLHETCGVVANEGQFSATLVLVAKFPQLGKCKTRLAAHPSVGPQFAFDFARASILDILSRFDNEELDAAVTQALVGDKSNDGDEHHHATIQRIVAYAPTESGDQFRDWVSESLGSQHKWEFVPFNPPVASEQFPTMPAHVAASHLSAGLQNLLEQFGGRVNSSPVVFIGMDTPHLSVDQVATGVKVASLKRAEEDNSTPPCAFICPATDGGYVMLALPACATASNVFDPDVLTWSSTNTFATQVKAITDGGIGIKVGQSYCDVDEREDVDELAKLIQMDTALAASLPRLAALLPELPDNK